MNSKDPFVGTFYVPDINEQENLPRVYSGEGDPNDLPFSYFQPPPRPGDRYLQLDADPVIEWVYTIHGYWIEVGQRYDTKAPDNTLILDVII